MAINWDAGAAKITSITAYEWNRRKLNQDQDSSPFQILESPLWMDRARQFSQELRIASNGGGRLNWIVGGYYLHENLKSYTDFELLGQFNPTPGQPYFDPANSIMTVGRRYTQRTDSRALFGQADYALAEGLKATVGFRYTWDRKKLDFITVAGPVDEPGRLLRTPLIGLLDSDPGSPAIDAPIRTNDSFNKPTWRLSLDYKIDPHILVYASYNRGFRSGGWNTGALVSPTEFSFVRPEKIDAYEAGIKSDLLDRKLRVNASAYYYDYHDLQVFTLEPGTPVPFQRLQNADAQIYGAEVEITARPFAGLELTTGAAYLHTKYTKLNDVLRGDLSGNRLDKAPTWQLSGSITYSTRLNDRLKGHIGADASYQTKVFFSTTNTSPLVRGAYGLLNAQIGVDDSKTGIGALLFVKNLTQKSYLQDVIDISSFGSYGFFYNEPRTIGVTLSYKM